MRLKVTVIWLGHISAWSLDLTLTSLKSPFKLDHDDCEIVVTEQYI